MNALLDRLDAWRHLPNYQLERRADILFALVLPQVMSTFVGQPVRGTLIPEFPIKRDLIWPDKPTRKSVKVDYLALSEDGSTAWLVELKTDSASRRDAQDHYLKTASALGLGALLTGYIDILQGTSAHQKYAHLTFELAGMGLLNVPPEVRENAFPTVKTRQLRAALKGITVGRMPTDVRVLYVQPGGGDAESVMDFAYVADALEQMDTPLACRFATSLRTWRTAAGAVEPR